MENGSLQTDSLSKAEATVPAKKISEKISGESNHTVCDPGAGRSCCRALLFYSQLYDP